MSKSDNWEGLFPQGPHLSGDDESISAAMGEDNEDMIEEKKGNGRGDRDRPNTVRSDKNDVTFDVGRSLENPPSWVSPITLDRTKYLMRYPPIGR